MNYSLSLVGKYFILSLCGPGKHIDKVANSCVIAWTLDFLINAVDTNSRAHVNINKIKLVSCEHDVRQNNMFVIEYQIREPVTF